jgi:Bacterial dnaA protein helix-turn-helix
MALLHSARSLDSSIAALPLSCESPNIMTPILKRQYSNNTNLTPKSANDNDLGVKGHPKEPRVFGDDRFLETLSLPMRAKPKYQSLEKVAQQVCTQYSITLDDLRSSSRRRSLFTTRAAFTKQARNDGLASLSEIARFLHRSASSVLRVTEYHAANP